MQMSEALAFWNPSIMLIWGNLRGYFQFGHILKKIEPKHCPTIFLHYIEKLVNIDLVHFLKKYLLRLLHL